MEQKKNSKQPLPQPSSSGQQPQQPNNKKELARAQNKMSLLAMSIQEAE